MHYWIRFVNKKMQLGEPDRVITHRKEAVVGEAGEGEDAVDVVVQVDLGPGEVVVEVVVVGGEGTVAVVIRWQVTLYEYHEPFATRSDAHHAASGFTAYRFNHLHLGQNLKRLDFGVGLDVVAGRGSIARQQGSLSAT